MKKLTQVLAFILFSLSFTTYLQAEETFELNLKSGLNYISIPVGTSHKIKELLSGIPGNKQVAYWDTAKNNYLYYADDPDFDQFSTFEYAKGYWIYLEVAGATISITDSAPSNYSLALKTGWNAIGCPYNRDIPVEEALFPLQIGIDYSSVWRFSSPDPPYYQAYARSRKEFTHLKPGEGYWIKMLKDATWTITQRLSISVNPKLWDIGSVTVNSIRTLSPANKITVTNDGSEPETFELRLIDPPGWTASTSPGEETYTLTGLFCNLGDVPLEPDFSNEDAITVESQRATDTVFSYSPSTANGVAVPAGDKRSLYLQFKSPTITQKQEEQEISLIVSCSTP